MGQLQGRAQGLAQCTAPAGEVLRRLALDGLDQAVSVQRWIDTTVASVTAGSASDTATGYVVPASLSGIGAVVIETGDYLMEVG